MVVIDQWSIDVPLNLAANPMPGIRWALFHVNGHLWKMFAKDDDFQEWLDFVNEHKGDAEQCTVDMSFPAL